MRILQHIQPTLRAILKRQCFISHMISMKKHVKSTYRVNSLRRKQTDLFLGLSSREEPNGKPFLSAPPYLTQHLIWHQSRPRHGCEQRCWLRGTLRRGSSPLLGYPVAYSVSASCLASRQRIHTLLGLAIDPSAAAHADPLTPASLWTALVPHAPAAHALEAEWVAVPPGRAGWAW